MEKSGILIYLLLINAGAFILFAVDKWKAVHGKWRISERTLFLSALFGGAAGSLLGMYICRHKTRKLKFTVGIPLILLLQSVILFWWYR